jgi:hypothetical protein
MATRNSRRVAAGAPAPDGSPQVGEPLLISEDSDPELCTPGETVTVMQVEQDVFGRLFVLVDGRKDFRRFLWA